MTEILVVNNNTKHLEPLLARLAMHYDIDVVDYRPGVVFNKNVGMYLLSGGGGEGMEATDRQPDGSLWYEDEIRLIQETDKPLLGICMGHELICESYDAEVVQLPAPFIGWNNISTACHDLPPLITQFNSQEWSVPSVPPSLIERARSPRGVEIVEAPDRPIVGVQFHPELGGSRNLPYWVEKTAA